MTPVLIRSVFNTLPGSPSELLSQDDVSNQHILFTHAHTHCVHGSAVTVQWDVEHHTTQTRGVQFSHGHGVTMTYGLRHRLHVERNKTLHRSDGRSLCGENATEGI